MMVWILVFHLTLPGGGPGSDVPSISVQQHAYASPERCETDRREMAAKTSWVVECRRLQVVR